MSRPEPFADWSHPDIINPEVARDAWDQIAQEATAALWRRRDGYPAQIKAGHITPEDAAKDIEAWEAISADWEWIATGIGTSATGQSLDLRIEALDQAIGRFLKLIRRNILVTQEQLLQGALLAAMRWWAERERQPDFTKHIRWLAQVGHAGRASLKDQTPDQERKAA